MALEHRLGPLSAVLIGLGMIAWMYSGEQGIMTAQATTTQEPSPSSDSSVSQESQMGKAAVSVQAAALSSQIISNSMTLSGETQANTSLSLTNQIAGRVTKVHAKKGDFLKKGSAILEIDRRTLEANLAQAQALLSQYQLELDGIKRLSSQKLASQVSYAKAKAALESAKANVTSLEVSIENSTITAPFSGVLNDFSIKPGQWLNLGEQVATLVDIQPLKISVNIPQLNMSDISLATPVDVTLNNGTKVTSKVSYISSVADTTTRTLPIEIEIPNQHLKLPAGVSAQVIFHMNKIKAHAFSPALLNVNDQGKMSVKTLNLDNKVISKPITVVRSERDKVWVTGLPDKVNIITVGQGFVKDGDIVAAHY